MRRDRRCWVFALLCLGLWLPGAARADLARGLAALKQGAWAEAEQQLRDVSAADRPAAALALAELRRLTGNYGEAAQLAAATAKQPALKTRALTLLGEVRLETGQHSEAIRQLTAALLADPQLARARVLLGIAYWETGQLPQAQRHFHRLIEAYADGQIDRKNAEALTAVAQACRYLERWQDANALFREAVQADPQYVLANLEWAELFLLKYNPAGAAESLQEALKVNPNHPRALALAAQLQLEQGYRVPQALQLVQKCLQQHPRLPEAFLIKARLQLDNAEFAGAEAEIRRALETNPNHLRALALMAASRYLQDDRQGYEQWRARALKVNPKFADFYPIVAEFAERHHWYAECIELHRAALAIDPNHAGALYGLGVAYLRTNREPEGLAALRKAWDRDPFNVRNFNLLNLFEEIIPKEYETVTRGPLVFRWNKAEAAAMGPAVEELVRRAWATYTQKYGFTPKQPLTLEMYTSRDHFSVRTLGLPDLGAQGVCFGEMITAISPAVGEANWEEVFWHELAHVFHLQLSRNRVPRWFTEGLAEYETNLARPEWRREHSRDIFFSLKRGELWSVRDLNPAFTRPGRPNGVVIAYQQSSLIIHYLVETHGFPKILQALRLYGEGKHDEEVLRTITGHPIEQLDAGFRRWLAEKRFPHYERGLLIDFEHLAARLDDLRARAEATPNADLLADLAAAWHSRRNFDGAADVARRALALNPGHARARYILALSLLQIGKRAEGKAELEALLAAGQNGYGIQMNLARLALEAKDLETAEKHFQAAKPWDPDQTAPYEQLAALYEQQGRAEAALAELAGICRIREHSREAAQALLEKCVALGKPEKVIEYAPLALAIQPAEPFALAQYGTQLLRAKDYRAAIPILERAVAAATKKSDLRGLLALAYLEAGATEKARAAAEETLKDDPGHPEARAVLRRLNE